METVITVICLGVFCLISIFMLVVPMIFIALVLKRANERAHLRDMILEQQFMQAYQYNQRVSGNWPPLVP